MEITVLIITLDLNVVVGLPCLDLVADSADTTTNIVYMLESFTTWVVLAIVYENTVTSPYDIVVVVFHFQVKLDFRRINVLDT